MSSTHVLIYQLGKVGSKAVRRTLQAAGAATFHMHRPELAAEQLRLSREAGHRIVVITASRDLLARNISAFFENMSNPQRPEIFVAEAAEVLAMTPEQRSRNSMHATRTSATRRSNGSRRLKG